MTRTFVACAALVAAATASIGPRAAFADPVADFYNGRTITILIGSGFGGSYGLYSQLASRHIGKQIPGDPTVIVKSMPGAGGMKALAYAYNVALKDGSVIDLAHQEVLQWTILDPKVRFDVRHFNWLGRFVDVNYIGVASKKSGVRSLDDARKRQVVAGATGLRSASGLAPKAFNMVAGTKFKVVAGYKGTNPMFLAQEKGEIDLVTASWVIVRAAHAKAFNSGQLVPIYAVALKRIPELPNVPTITEFGLSDAQKAFLHIWAAGGIIGRSLATPPKVPADRLKALRVAFDRMIKDPAFLDDVKTHKIPFNPMSGAELTERVDKVMQLTPEQIAGTRRVYGKLVPSAESSAKAK